MALFGNLGVMMYNYDYKLSGSQKVDNSGTDIFLGAGARAYLGENAAVDVGLRYTSKDRDHADGSQIRLGVGLTIFIR